MVRNIKIQVKIFRHHSEQDVRSASRTTKAVGTGKVVISQQRMPMSETGELRKHGSQHRNSSHDFKTSFRVRC